MPAPGPADRYPRAHTARRPVKLALEELTPRLVPSAVPAPRPLDIPRGPGGPATVAVAAGATYTASGDYVVTLSESGRTGLAAFTLEETATVHYTAAATASTVYSYHADVVLEYDYTRTADGGVAVDVQSATVTVSYDTGAGPGADGLGQGVRTLNG